MSTIILLASGVVAMLGVQLLWTFTGFGAILIGLGIAAAVAAVYFAE